MSNALDSALSTSFFSSTLPSASYTTSLLTTQEPIQKGQKEPFSRCFVSQIISQVKARVQIFLHKRQKFPWSAVAVYVQIFFFFLQKAKSKWTFFIVKYFIGVLRLWLFSLVFLLCLGPDYRSELGHCYGMRNNTQTEK